jgi:hypothetical protein
MLLIRSKIYDLTGQNLCIDGNSISTYTVYTIPLLATIQKYGMTVNNVAVPGASTSVIAGTAATRTDSKIAQGKLNFLLLFEGTNELRGNGAGNSALLFKQYCLARRTAGWIIVACVPPPLYIDGDISSTSRYLEYADILRKEWRTYANMLIDFQKGIPQLSLPDGSSDPVFFPDRIHPVEASGLLMGVYAGRRLQRVPVRPGLSVGGY